MDSIKLEDIAKNLNEISWDILDILKKKEDVTYTALRELLGVSQEKSNSEIARLEGALLIASARDLKDRRILLFNISEYGKAIFEYRK